MDRIAVFVDAGYLFAQGSAALTGSKKPRTSIILDTVKAINSLKALAQEKGADCKLLRIYWYDGAIGVPRPTTDQAALASLDDVKLRLGFVNSSGQQKGVDSLIVTDLIELARLKSISDALLLSGDEDVRVGVQIAQNYGVRVHLLGIFPSRGSQSHQLLQEADTTTEWNSTNLEEFLSVRNKVETVDEVVPEAQQIDSAESDEVSAEIEVAVQRFVDALSDAELKGLKAYWDSERGVPPEFDRKLLPICRVAIKRNLERSEVKLMRGCFQRRALAKIKSS